jgi:hypothetical protein
MQPITLTFTVEEVTLLATLASDQLFRRQFIDPKMPGYKADPAEVNIGKALVGRMRLTLDQDLRANRPAPAPASAPARALAATHRRL